jgi:membrane protease YdiL (CAAX protease family)
MARKHPFPRLLGAVVLIVLIWVTSFGGNIGLNHLRKFFILTFTHTWYYNQQLVYRVYLICWYLIELLGFIIPIFIGYKLTRRPFREVFRLNKVNLKLFLSCILFGVGVIFVVSTLHDILLLFIEIPPFLKKWYIGDRSTVPFIISVLYMAVRPAILEEALFRGVILDGFSKNYSERKAIILSAVLFMLMHGNPVQFIVSFVTGYIFAWLCYRTNSIFPAITLHFINNILSLVQEQFATPAPLEPRFPVETPSQIAVTCAVILASVAVSALMIRTGYRFIAQSPYTVACLQDKKLT